MEFSEDVLVLRVGTFREADCWVRFFSPTHGVLTGFAFGGRRSRRRFCGCLDPLSQVRFTVSQNRRKEYYLLEEGTLVEHFSNLKTDLKKLGVVSNCVRFFESLLVGPDGTREAYVLLREMLQAVNENSTVSSFLPFLFRAKMSFSQGYEPNFAHCRQCGRLFSDCRRLGFSVQDGALYCASCMIGKGRLLPMSQETRELLTGLAKSAPKDWITWNPPAHVREETVPLVDAFVQFHLGLTCTGTRFVRC